MIVAAPNMRGMHEVPCHRFFKRGNVVMFLIDSGMYLGKITHKVEAKPRRKK